MREILWNSFLLLLMLVLALLFFDTSKSFSLPMGFDDRPNLLIDGLRLRYLSLLSPYFSLNNLSVLRNQEESNLAVALAAPVKAKRASVCKQEREQQILGGADYRASPSQAEKGQSDVEVLPGQSCHSFYSSYRSDSGKVVPFLFQVGCLPQVSFLSFILSKPSLQP
jgi:hypothetical protein